MCWAKQQFKTPEKAAASLSTVTVRYIKDRAAGMNPAVPDVLWHGDDCWLMHNDECKEFNRQVRDVVLQKSTG